MPTYEYRCNTCGVIIEETHSIKETPLLNCKSCDSPEPLERLISFNKAGFILKGGTEAINWKEKRHRHKKNADLAVRELERWGSTQPKLTPNVNGETYESWNDASKAAKDKGLNSDSYQPMVEKEKRVGSYGIDDNKWKTVKENRDKA